MFTFTTQITLPLEPRCVSLPHTTDNLDMNADNDS